jgi:prepilin-type N-terminal cleavage/methylation domain-containing protein
MDENDKGFTLVELLVVMIIIGILAAIAIPVFMNQREKARDTAARSDVSTLGKEIATYYVDAEDALVAGDVTLTGGEYNVAGNPVGNASDNITAVALTPGGTTVAAASAAWCVAVTYDGGSDGDGSQVHYSADGGLDDGAC